MQNCIAYSAFLFAPCATPRSANLYVQTEWHSCYLYLQVIDDLLLKRSKMHGVICHVIWLTWHNVTCLTRCTVLHVLSMRYTMGTLQRVYDFNNDFSYNVNTYSKRRLHIFARFHSHDVLLLTFVIRRAVHVNLVLTRARSQYCLSYMSSAKRRPDKWHMCHMFFGIRHTTTRLLRRLILITLWFCCRLKGQ